MMKIRSPRLGVDLIEAIYELSINFIRGFKKILRTDLCITVSRLLSYLHFTKTVI